MESRPPRPRPRPPARADTSNEAKRVGIATGDADLRGVATKLEVNLRGRAVVVVETWAEVIGEKVQQRLAILPISSLRVLNETILVKR